MRFRSLGQDEKETFEAWLSGVSRKAGESSSKENISEEAVQIIKPLIQLPASRKRKVAEL